MTDFSTVSFIGAGRITRAIVQGLITYGWPKDRLRVVSRSGSRARSLAEEYGVIASPDPVSAVLGADLVVLAVHPHEAVEALSEVGDVLTPTQVLVSVVASCTTEALQAAAPGVPVVRAVPNVGVAVHHGMTVVASVPDLRADLLSLVYDLFEPVGRVLTVGEEHMETVSAISGAGPALVSRFAQALANAAAAQGLASERASELAAHAIKGAGVLLVDAGQTTGEICGSVASPGGMTEAALLVLEQRDIDDMLSVSLHHAVEISLNRLAALFPGG
ncbi:pyrroline-5-carboxylate reductase family protein [Streptomyces sp. NPDC001118]